ncbi:MAG: asparagine synthase (glutamine-hydrolyzing) [Candidatus Wallbacteria bacterium HGW-Wallbacteria-1]|jgi:asparagine synthase (glutamine-hydrolysing)|uniref:asparagine synthase (glutamine-hydrolyzing) n=1 Tax=Candidatus Wallbacteria bacterium HGW-Wallbacteria-1 TaxID=2013854 RepID=A0A2N1PLI7_9BACT|nr:MAG: asparagine synthase (glutamine-hydrolyzing) [Candidatus Wallbacteria bacterium HGW-Wallbacteria-1]
MCGIAGTIALYPQALADPELILKMCDSMAHRGPDGEGFLWSSPEKPAIISRTAEQRPAARAIHVPHEWYLCLGHRRLSIIDLSGGAAQPMTGVRGRVWLTFNGEIYNHADLRRELTALGMSFATHHSDTETIIAGYQQWGLHGVLSRLRGMFAFCLVDLDLHRGWLVRDRIGIKPLYYTVRGGRLTFASEIKAILCDGSVERQINRKGLVDYLSFLTVPAPETLFQGIMKLPAGHLLEFSDHGAGEALRYWDPLDNQTGPMQDTFDNVAHRLLEQLDESVALRMMGDVPVGVFLSGGIDSTANAALFSRHTASEPVRAFSIGFHGGNYGSCPNEFEYARTAARYCGCQYHETSIGIDDLIDFLPSMVHFQDEPIADPVCVPLHFVAKLAKDNGVTVCQVGEGSDELFFGYLPWGRIKAFQEGVSRIPRPLLSAGAALASALGRGHSTKYEYLRRAANGLPIFWSGAEAFHETEKSILLSPSMNKQFRNYSSWEVVRPHYEHFRMKCPWGSWPDWMAYADLKLRLPELLLMRVDKMTMAVSLEGRVPFLDHSLVEFALSIPQDMRFREGCHKAVLKKSLRGVIPDSIIDRKKQGFGAPVHEWFMEKLGPYARKKIFTFCHETGLINPSHVDELFRIKNNTRLWFLLNLSLWWEHFITEDAKGGSPLEF